MATKRRRVVRPNPRLPEHVGQPWDVAVPLEYLPPEIARFCAQANEVGHFAWAGAWSKTEPGKTAHFVSKAERLPRGVSDALKELGFRRGWLVPGHWYWSHDGVAIVPDDRYPSYRDVDNGVLPARWVSEVDPRAAALGAAACVRSVLQFLPDESLDVAQHTPAIIVDPGVLKAIDVVERWAKGEQFPVARIQRIHQIALSIYEERREFGPEALYEIEAALALEQLTDQVWRSVRGVGLNDSLPSAVAAVAEAFSSSVPYRDQHRVRIVVRAELADIFRFHTPIKLKR